MSFFAYHFCPLWNNLVFLSPQSVYMCDLLRWPCFPQRRKKAGGVTPRKPRNGGAAAGTRTNPKEEEKTHLQYTTIHNLHLQCVRVCVCVLRCCSRTHEKQYLILDNHRRRRQRVQRRALKSLQPAALRNMAALDPEMARWLMLVGWLVGAAETSALACAIASTTRL